MAKFKRKSAEFEDFKSFKIDSRSFSRQFSGIYKARLASLKVEVLKRAKLKWSDRDFLQIVDLTKDKYEETPCIIIGTLYKHQELKPSILKEMSEELQTIPQPPRQNYCSPRDSLFLEDDVARVKLVGNLNVDTLVTGLVCAVNGHGLSDGTFWVDDFCFPGLHLKPLTQTPSSCAKDHGKFLLFISGLDFINQGACLAQQLLSDWINGFVGDESFQEKAASIVRVIIAGNSIRGSPETFTRKGYFENKKKFSLFAANINVATNRFDSFISRIAHTCTVTLLPGEFDPTCHSLPQHPIHPHILPLTLKVGTLHGATNPWIGKIGSRIIGGSSGQPILDIIKVSNVDVSPIHWLEKTLEWMHFAPTAPDTLAEYPFDQSDSLVMNVHPNIYFAGNMEKFETKLLQGINGKGDYEGQPIRLICIPKFATTQTAVLVDLESLDAKQISFGSIQLE
ncbi:DNA polymerase delta subunit 2-like [Phymastichus coffea]|uniref:DNA polymerase delta subunit 2-like n=1 Tax=Phymastichus coffea TaxID=108790 RepID=UPI00273BA3F1|nr:DNA polymerase delta subunit 2-like [Phymastichus coffea]